MSATRITSTAVKTHQPCPLPGCGSSDAFSLYDDGHGFCFSCKRNYWGKESLKEFKEEGYSYQFKEWRGISLSTFKYFDVKTKVDAEGRPISIAFPYANGFKIRSLDEKRFWTEGETGPSLFGMQKFAPGASKSVTIFEGELDTLSGWQMLGRGYAAVSVRSASSAKADCSAPDVHKWLDSFERIYLCFDSDEPGQRAKRAVASLFDFNKVYDVQLPSTEKWDANRFLTEGKDKEFSQLWWNAKRFMPEGVISSFSEFEEILSKSKVKEGESYPFKTLNNATYGIRTGEVVLFTALEGVGKTEIIRAIEYHLLKYTSYNLGLIHLEENKGRLLSGLAGYELGVPCHLPDSAVNTDDTYTALKKLVGRDDRLHLYSHFGSSDPDIILGVVRFLAGACNCKFIFLDHISILVSGLTEESERKTLDYISTRLAMMVEELDFALIMVSHVNDFLQTRGSRNISKVADIWIHLDRNLKAESETERNITTLTINKNRFAGRTGPAGKLLFDPGTYKVEDLDTSVLPPLAA